MKTKIKSNSNIKSALAAILGSLFLSVSLALRKELSPDIPEVLIAFFRSLFGLLLILPIFLIRKKVVLKTTKSLWYVLRVILMAFALLLTYYAYGKLPLNFATTIGMSGPLFTIVLSLIFFKKKLGVKQWLLVILGYVGVFIVIRPTSFSLNLAVLSSLLANILIGGSLIVSKILSKHDSTATIILYTNIGITLILFALSFNSWIPISSRDWIILLIMGILGTMVQIFTITALKYSTPLFVAPFEYTRLIFATGIGFVIFLEIPDTYTVVGSVVILFSAYMLARLSDNKLDCKDCKCKMEC